MSPQRILEVLTPEKHALIALIAGERSSTHAGPILPFFYFYFSVDSTSILLFFRSTESHGKTRSVFTPPLLQANRKCYNYSYCFVWHLCPKTGCKSFWGTDKKTHACLTTNVRKTFSFDETYSNICG
jgi:hypothetical protein